MEHIRAILIVVGKNCILILWWLSRHVIYWRVWSITSYIEVKNPSQFFYLQVFRPVSASARLYINPYAEVELKTPKIECNVEVQRIVIEFTKPQASWFGIYHPFQFVMNYSVFSLENILPRDLCAYMLVEFLNCLAVLWEKCKIFSPLCNNHFLVILWHSYLWILWESPDVYSALAVAFFSLRECGHE